MKRRNYSNSIPKLATGTNPNLPASSEFFSTVTRITYLVKPDGDVAILGVFHGALDIDRYLV
jgi:hypothetical protein